MTTLALCMAGVYRRFRDAGYQTPKFLLPIPGSRPTILGTIASELVGERPSGARVLLVANRRDEAHADAIRAAVPGGVLQFVGDTDGQARTAMVAAQLALDLGWGGEPFVLHNVDTVLYDRDLDAIGEVLRGCDGFIDVFDADSPAYSYVKLDAAGFVTEMAEKVVISRHATTGLYGFRSPEAYLAAAEATTGRSSGEFYVSDVYAAMLARGARIRVDPTPRRTLILGTPAEYEAHLAESRR